MHNLLKAAALFTAPAKYNVTVLETVLVRDRHILATDRYTAFSAALPDDVAVEGPEFALSVADVKRIVANKQQITAFKHENGLVTVARVYGPEETYLNANPNNDYPRVEKLFENLGDPVPSTLTLNVEHLARLDKMRAAVGLKSLAVTLEGHKEDGTGIVMVKAPNLEPRVVICGLRR